MANQPPIEKMSPRALLAWRVGAVAVAVAFLVFIIVALATNGDANTGANVADTNTVTPISTPQWDTSASDTNQQKLAYDLALKGLPMLTVDKYLAVQPVNQNELFTYGTVGSEPCAALENNLNWLYVETLDTNNGMPVDLTTFQEMVGVGVMVACPQELPLVPTAYQP